MAQAIDKGLLTTNEGRRYLKKPKLDGGIGDTPMVNGSYLPLSQAEKGINYKLKTGKGGNTDDE